MPAIDVVSDASVVVKWFHDEDDAELAPARALLTCHRDRRIGVQVLDLTPYEVGNALLRGRAQAVPDAVALVLRTLRSICPVIVPTDADLRMAAMLADRHGLTLYDSAYAAVARRRDAALVTLDRELLRSGLGRRPSELVDELESQHGD